MAVWVHFAIDKTSYPKIVLGYRKDRENYLNRLGGVWADHVDQVICFHEWPDEDGVLMLKASDESVEDALKRLHPRVRPFLEMAAKKNGPKDRGLRFNEPVFLKMHSETVKPHHSQKGGYQKKL